MNRRRHGWQRPFHPLQIVGIAVYSFLVVSFYTFFGLFLGNRIAEITVTTIFSFVAVSVMFLFIRCTATDPTDKTSLRKKKPKARKGYPKLNYGFILGQIIVRFFRRMERKILRTFIRRRYLDPWKTGAQLDPLLPFPFVLMKEDAVSPDLREDDISFCALCDFEVKKHSKHCRTCNRCVDGFDHHCRWLNNCVGKKNYTTFILLMIFVLLLLIIEGATAIAIFIRCFVDKNGIEQELKRKLYVDFPRGVLATISVLLTLMIAYGSAAMGQLFFFHVVLIRKGMRTYDYILAMKEESQSIEMDPFDDSDFSSDLSSDFDSPEKPSFISRFICRGRGVTQNTRRLSIRIDGDPQPSTSTVKQGFRVSIDPWRLIKLSKEKALIAAEKARERIVKQKPPTEEDPLKPLPLETKCGPLTDKNTATAGSGLTPLISKGWMPGSPGRFPSPRRRFSGSSTMFSGIVPSPQQKYRNNFDLKLTEVSRELETYISRQVLCSVIKKDGTEASPR
ncbi:hypothetical protein PRUPE_3G002400 [Prunus persica]|uniref:S-acyltransferase n=1 Tax=Prunus persica TaxID=3760 RepID=M5XUA8_PRUPE|nr:protein S-acyltransferase 18 isoform X2 [Prunus persica]ONI14688.1 hypothetical protein PRUPE_3G002400 [Prunus persica]